MKMAKISWFFYVRLSFSQLSMRGATRYEQDLEKQQLYCFLSICNFPMAEIFIENWATLKSLFVHFSCFNSQYRHFQSEDRIEDSQGTKTDIANEDDTSGWTVDRRQTTYPVVSTRPQLHFVVALCQGRRTVWLNLCDSGNNTGSFKTVTRRYRAGRRIQTWANGRLIPTAYLLPSINI